jgi:hypothetical protein
MFFETFSVCTSLLGVDADVHKFLTATLVGDEWSTSPPGRFTSDKAIPGTQWLGCLVCPAAGLNFPSKEESLSPTGNWTTNRPAHSLVTIPATLSRLPIELGSFLRMSCDKTVPRKMSERSKIWRKITENRLILIIFNLKWINVGQLRPEVTEGWACRMHGYRRDTYTFFRISHGGHNLDQGVAAQY